MKNSNDPQLNYSIKPTEEDLKSFVTFLERHKFSLEVDTEIDTYTIYMETEDGSVCLVGTDSAACEDGACIVKLGDGRVVAFVLKVGHDNSNNPSILVSRGFQRDGEYEHTVIEPSVTLDSNWTKLNVELETTYVGGDDDEGHDEDELEED